MAVTSRAGTLLRRDRRLLAAASLFGLHLRQKRSLVSAIKLLFLLAIVVIPYPIRVWCFHLGSPFEPIGSVTLVVGLALTACTWMAMWFYAMWGCRLMDQRLAPNFVQQMTRRYGIATLVQIAAVPAAFAAPRFGVAIALLSVAFFWLPQPKPRYQPGHEPTEAEKSND